MEDVHYMILSTLSKLQCTFRENETPHNFVILVREDVAEGIVKLLWAIDPNFKDKITGYKLQVHAAQKFQVATLIVNTENNFGFKDPIGYHTLLYANAFKIRRIFLTLIEKYGLKSFFYLLFSANFEQLIENIGEKVKNDQEANWTAITTTVNSFTSVTRACSVRCSTIYESIGYGQNQVTCADCCRTNNCNSNFSVSFYMNVMKRQHTSWTTPLQSERNFIKQPFFLACTTTAEQNTSIYNESDSTNLLEEVECACEKVKRCFRVGLKETVSFVNGLSLDFVPAERLKFLDECTSEKIQTYCFKDKDDSIRGYIEPTDSDEEVAEFMFYENMTECFKREGWNVTSPIVKKIRLECAKEVMKHNIQVFKYSKPCRLIHQWNLAKAEEANFKKYYEEFVETKISNESRAYGNIINAFNIFWFVVVSFLL